MQTVAVIGAGTMGHGIAQVAAVAGARVRLVDAQPGAAATGLARIADDLAGGVARDKITGEDRDATLARLEAVDDLAEAVHRADLVIEAIPEELGLKQRVLAAAEAAAPAHAILATNTSSLAIGRIAEALERPARFLGTHFFNPVPRMKLLELVRGDATDADVVEAVGRWGDALGKTVIVVRDMPGFATSRLGVALGMEAIRMVEQGVASAEDIDAAMELGYRHPMGPLKLTDLVGLDVRMAIGTYLAEALGNPAFEPPALMRRMVDEGRLGKKSGEGFYRW